MSVNSYARQGALRERVTTSRPDAADRTIKTLLFNYHALGGFRIPGIFDVNSCYNVCLAHESCYGFDFDSLHNTCWLHGGQRICSAVEAKRNCTLYRLIECGKAAILEKRHMSTMCHLRVCIKQSQNTVSGTMHPNPNLPTQGETMSSKSGVISSSPLKPG